MSYRSDTRGTLGMALNQDPGQFSRKLEYGLRLTLLSSRQAFPYLRQGAAPDSRNFMTPRPVQCLLCQAMSSEVAFNIARRNGGLSFHISPLRSSAFPIHWQSDFRVQRRQDHQLRGMFPPQGT